MPYPLLRINLSKITHNSQRIVEVCTSSGIETVGVVKGCSGDPEVAKAMLAGGVSAIADSRVCSLRRLKAAGITDLVMLRQPLRDEAEEVVELASVSLVSDYSIALELSRAAQARRTNHSLILMIETGDSREGMLPEEAVKFAPRILALRNIELIGIGTPTGCLFHKKAHEGTTALGYSRPAKQVKLLAGIAQDLSSIASGFARIVSGGNSLIWRLLASRELPPVINQVRIGEAILLGRETLFQEPVAGTFQNAFILESEVMEIRDKPLIPWGKSPTEMRVSPLRKQAVVAIGRQDIGAGQLFPCSMDVSVLGITSDHLVVEVSEKQQKLEAGQLLSFIPDYQALAAAMISPFVDKLYLREGEGADFELSNLSGKVVE